MQSLNNTKRCWVASSFRFVGVIIIMVDIVVIVVVGIIVVRSDWHGITCRNPRPSQ